MPCRMGYCADIHVWVPSEVGHHCVHCVHGHSSVCSAARSVPPHRRSPVCCTVDLGLKCFCQQSSHPLLYLRFLLLPQEMIPLVWCAVECASAGGSRRASPRGWGGDWWGGGEGRGGGGGPPPPRPPRYYDDKAGQSRSVARHCLGSRVLYGTVVLVPYVDNFEQSLSVAE